MVFEVLNFIDVPVFDAFASLGFYLSVVTAPMFAVFSILKSS